MSTMLKKEMIIKKERRKLRTLRQKEGKRKMVMKIKWSKKMKDKNMRKMDNKNRMGRKRIRMRKILMKI